MRVRMTHRDSGSVMFAVLLFAGAISIIGFAASTLVVSGNKSVHQIAALKQAHYMAEMGIEEALSSPLTFQKSFQGTVELENGRLGRYITSARQRGNKMELRSTGFVSPKTQLDSILAKKTIICRFSISANSVLNAIATSQDLSSGKVYVNIDSYTDEQGNTRPVTSSADVYSEGNVRNIAGNIPGSVIAQGGVVLDNGALVAGDVHAKRDITLDVNAKAMGRIISGTGNVFLTQNNEARGDIIAKGRISLNKSTLSPNQNGNKIRIISTGESAFIEVNDTDIKNTTDSDIVTYSYAPKSVSLTKANVHKIYTWSGDTQVEKKNSTYTSINRIGSSEYNPSYTVPPVPRRNLPEISETTKSLLIEQARGDGFIYNGLNVNGQFTINGSAYIDGDLVLNNNSTLKIPEGSVIYVTGKILIENNASVSVFDGDDDDSVVNQGSSFVTESYFDVRNNAIPELLSLVALGTSTSYLKNNSATTGAILVPNGTLEISNRAKIIGGVFAKSISIGNNAEIDFNPYKSLLTLPVGAFTGNPHEVLELTEWIEN